MTRQQRQHPWAMLSFCVNVVRLAYTLFCHWR